MRGDIDLMDNRTGGERRAMSFTDHVVENTFKQHPYMFILICIVFGAGMSWTYSVFAEKTDVEAKFIQVETRMDSLDTSVASLSKKIHSEFTRQRINSLKSEIFQYQRLEGADGFRPRDQLHLDKLLITLSDEVKAQGIQNAR